MPELEKTVKDGAFHDMQGNVIGRHDGYPFYTIGQRKGLGQAFGEPKYVTKIDPKTNTVVLGDVKDLLKNKMLVRDVNLMKYENLPEPLDAVTMVRYNDRGTNSSIKMIGQNVEVNFYANVRGIAPGQSAVFYENEDVIGGGIISVSAN